MSITHRGPGKWFRKGISLLDLMKEYPDEATAEQWFVKIRWPNGKVCPVCGSKRIADRRGRLPVPFHCRDCKKDFSVKTGTVMHKSKLGLRTWIYAIFLMNTSLKGVSSMKLARELDVTQKTAWYLEHRIRLAFSGACSGAGLFEGPVEVDETYIGGSDRTRHQSKKKPGRGVASKQPVVAILDRATKQVRAEAVYDTTKLELHGFIEETVLPDASVITDDYSSYRDLPNPHFVVKHSTKKFVDGQAHTNGVESFWSTLKRGYEGVYHWMSPKHLDRYVQEFVYRYNLRVLDTADQLERTVKGMLGQRLSFESLINSEP